MVIAADNNACRLSRTCLNRSSCFQPVLKFGLSSSHCNLTFRERSEMSGARMMLLPDTIQKQSLETTTILLCPSVLSSKNLLVRMAARLAPPYSPVTLSISPMDLPSLRKLNIRLRSSSWFVCKIKGQSAPVSIRDMIFASLVFPILGPLLWNTASGKFPECMKRVSGVSTAAIHAALWFSPANGKSTTISNNSAIALCASSLVGLSFTVTFTPPEKYTSVSLLYPSSTQIDPAPSIGGNATTVRRCLIGP